MILWFININYPLYYWGRRHIMWYIIPVLYIINYPIYICRPYISSSPPFRNSDRGLHTWQAILSPPPTPCYVRCAPSFLLRERLSTFCPRWFASNRAYDTHDAGRYLLVNSCASKSPFRRIRIHAIDLSRPMVQPLVHRGDRYRTQCQETKGGAIVEISYQDYIMWYDMIWYAMIWYDMIWYYYTYYQYHVIWPNFNMIPAPNPRIIFVSHITWHYTVYHEYHVILYITYRITECFFWHITYQVP